MDDSEHQRILSEHARRDATGLPDRYAATDPAVQLSGHELQRVAAQALRRAGQLPLAGRRLLDGGCGTGGFLTMWLDWGVRGGGPAGLGPLAPRAGGAREGRAGGDGRGGGA